MTRLCSMRKLFYLSMILLGTIIIACGCGTNLQPAPKPTATIGANDQQSLDAPQGIAVLPNGELLVADTWNDRIVKYKDATQVATWGGTGTAPGKFSAPVDVAVDSANNVYATDGWNHRIQKFSVDGTLIKTWGKNGAIAVLATVKGDDFSYPLGIALDKENNVYVADSGNSRITKFSSEGKPLLQFGKDGKQEGFVNAPLDVAVDGAGNIYVTDSGNSRVQVFDPKGKYARMWGKKGNDPGQFIRPSGIALDAQGNVYVVDSGNHRVQKFDSSGKLLTIIGKRGKGEGEFESPESIAIGKDGKIYVLDWGNKRIQVFQ